MRLGEEKDTVMSVALSAVVVVAEVEVEVEGAILSHIRIAEASSKVQQSEDTRYREGSVR